MIGSHQFKFRWKHGSIEQVLRIETQYPMLLQENIVHQYSLATGITQESDEVWHDEFQNKIKSFFRVTCMEYHLLMYLSGRQFKLKCNIIRSTIASYVEFRREACSNQLCIFFKYQIADESVILSSQVPEFYHVICKNTCNWLNDCKIKVKEHKKRHATFILKQVGNQMLQLWKILRFPMWRTMSVWQYCISKSQTLYWSDNFDLL